MKILRYIAIGLLSATAFGQTPRVVPPVQSIVEFRPISEMRIWTFVSRDTTLGRLISTVREKTTVDGHDGVVVQQEMALDMSKIGGVPMAKSSSRKWIGLDGAYLGEETKLISEDQSNDLNLEVDGTELSGYFTRGDEKVKQKIDWPKSRFVFDPYFVDEIELYMARRGLRVGDSFEDTVFSSQTLLYSTLAGRVDDFIYTELYKGRFDTVFVVRLTQPEAYTLLITPDFRLLRVDFSEHGRMRAYLDRVAMPQAGATSTAAQAKPLTIVEKVMRGAHWLTYSLLGLGILWLFARGQYRPSPNWVGLLGGALIYVVVIFMQFPAQGWLIMKLMTPQSGSHTANILAGLAPSLLAGLIQQAFILGLLLQVAKQFQLSRNRLPVVGAFIGAGFAILEALYQTTPGPLWGWQLLERTYMILFHISAGYLIGYLLALRWGVWVGWAALVVANSLIRFLPILVLQQLVNLEILRLIAVIITLAVVGGAVLITRKPLPKQEAAVASSGAPVENPLT